LSGGHEHPIELSCKPAISRDTAGLALGVLGVVIFGGALLATHVAPAGLGAAKRPGGPGLFEKGRPY
jgi:hypothetical protein